MLDERAVPAAELRATNVRVRPGWTVQDVLSAAKVMAFSSFSLMTPAVEGDVSAGEADTVAATFNLLGVDPSGAIYFQCARTVLWSDFVRATETGLFAGDPRRLVAYPYGVAGGPAPDGLWSLVQWLFDHREVVLETSKEIAELAAGIGTTTIGLRAVSKRRRRRIAEKWRRRGITARPLRHLLDQCPQWDPERLANLLELTPLEARLMLTNAGFLEGDDHLWRRADGADADAARCHLEGIEDRAITEMRSPGHRDFPPEEDDEGDDQPT